MAMNSRLNRRTVCGAEVPDLPMPGPVHQPGHEKPPAGRAVDRAQSDPPPAEDQHQQMW